MSALAAYAQRYDADRLFRYINGRPGKGGMSPGQRVFHQDPARFRFLRAANQTGKTTSGAAEDWMHALGSHPFRWVPPAPNVGWIVLPDLENDWAKVSAKLREMEPPDVLDPACRYDVAKGYMYGGARRVKLRNGSLILPKSGTQQQTALAGATIHWIHFDEPPRESHWGEALSRVAVNSGDAYLTFTPIGRPLEWLRDYFYGNDERDLAPHKEWSETVMRLTPESCPHRTAEDIAAQVSSYGPWEYKQRVDGEWEGITVGRRLGSFTEGCVLSDDQLPDSLEEIRVHWDHGESAGAQIGYISGRNQRRMYLLREIPGVAHSTPHEDAAAMLKALESLGVRPFDVARAFGDINSAGKLGAGGNVNAFLEAAFMDLLRMNAPPFEIERPRKGAGSVRAGEKAMNHAMKEGRWFVHESCTRFINAARHYTGAEKDLSHPLDAARYGWTDVLLSPPSRPGGGVTLVG